MRLTMTSSAPALDRPLRVLVVPIDTRPPGYVMPLRLAEIAGVDLVVPPAPLLGCFLQPGDPDALFSWMRQAAPNVDVLILSADMLCYGGLVASRTDTVTFEEARSRLSRLSDLRTAYPHASVLCFSTITRLTATGSDAPSLRISPLLFRYCELLEAARAGDESAREECASLDAEMPDGTTGRFLRIRERNHRVNMACIEAVAEGVIDYLLLPQEDAAPTGIHRVEQVALWESAGQLGVQDRVLIYPGADEAAALLLARAVQAWSGAAPARFAPIFQPASTAERIPPYEDRPLAASIASQIEAVGSVLMTADSDDVVRLMVWGGNDDETEARTSTALDQFISQIEDGLLWGRPTVIADVAAPNGCDPRLMARIASLRVPGIAGLHSLAGWNTAGNSLGTVLAHAICLGQARSRSAQPLPLAHYRFLFERIVDDWLYQSVVRPEINRRLRESGLLPENLGNRAPEIENEIGRRLVPLAVELFESRFGGVRCREGVLTRLADLTVRLPWPRTFEVEITALVECDSR